MCVFFDASKTWTRRKARAENKANKEDESRPSRREKDVKINQNCIKNSDQSGQKRAHTRTDFEGNAGQPRNRPAKEGKDHREIEVDSRLNGNRIRRRLGRAINTKTCQCVADVLSSRRSGTGRELDVETNWKRKQFRKRRIQDRGKKKIISIRCLSKQRRRRCAIDLHISTTKSRSCANVFTFLDECGSCFG